MDPLRENKEERVVWVGRVPLTHICYHMQNRQLAGSCCAAQEFSSVLCDGLEGCDGVGGREAQEGVMYVHTWLIHVVVQQKPTQHCKATILQ